MHILREYVERIGGLQGFASEVASNPVSQGVALDINPIWLYAYRLHCAGLTPSHFHGPWPDFGMAWYLIEMLMAGQTFDGDEIDFNWVDKSGWVPTKSLPLVLERSSFSAVKMQPKCYPSANVPLII